LLFLGGSVRVSPLQFPRVHALTREARAVFGYDEELDVFVTYDPAMNAGAVGVNRPFITLNSSIVAALDDEELLAVIAHELGHCMSGHILYKTLLWVLVNASFRMLRIPGMELAIYPVVAALREWDRKSELSADRAGLLACQNPDVSYRVLMKLAGGDQIGQMDINEFFQQAADYDEGSDIVDSVHKFLNTWSMTHPLPVIRIPELKRWVDDRSYETILGGTFVTRAEATEERVRDHIRRARERYREDFAESDDPGTRVAREIGSIVDTLGREGRRILRGIVEQFDDRDNSSE
jgi:Zn-dependent protease with chaperone function